ncbi:MAG TPA: MotA/TolQ/ExbB proton channel family protein [Firmicutes bacterium]|nr:MotA/TolQ/ExbB proton channel family protein [Bacillota bacterium]
MRQLIQSGGPVMYPLILCSVIVVTVTIERLWFFLSQRADLEDVKRVVLRLLEKEAPLDAIQYLQRINHPVTRMLQSGMIYFGKERDVLERNLKEAGEMEIKRMERGLGLLDVVVTASPLLGLLGTVNGIIQSFNIFSAAQGLPSATALGQGIAEALLTTAAGLMIAIPSLFIIHWLNSMIERRVQQMNLFSKDFLDNYGNRGVSDDV